MAECRPCRHSIRNPNRVGISAPPIPPGGEVLHGTLNKTLAPLTSSASGKVYVKAALSVTLAPLTVVATGTSSVVGTLAATLADLTLVATGAQVTGLMQLEDTTGYWLFEDNTRILWG